MTTKEQAVNIIKAVAKNKIKEIIFHFILISIYFVYLPFPFRSFLIPIKLIFIIENLK